MAKSRGGKGVLTVKRGRMGGGMPNDKGMARTTRTDMVGNMKGSGGVKAVPFRRGGRRKS